MENLKNILIIVAIIFTISCNNNDKAGTLNTENNVNNKNKSRDESPKNNNIITLNKLRYDLIDSRIEKAKGIYGEPDWYNILRMGSNDFILSYYVYYNKFVDTDGKVKHLVFFTLRNNHGRDMIDKIMVGNDNEVVYWNSFNHIKLSSR